MTEYPKTGKFRPASFMKILNILGDASQNGQSEICRRISSGEKRKTKVRILVISPGFSVGSKEAADALMLDADGYRTLSGPRATGDGC